ncbi:ABC transporter ATP-binding protein [Fluviispira multicolorata]|uniref:ATP-binding cassette domain-containing protein n=1 Tax=Fluviispira multicolorata TaxID=2654512 RepID=A0A833N355_9BACT|nr:ABC transporter ATP-binding protein [Fluviispira multicolorata]KAB8029225.1 ATP-binding cassette domain-containing protein [Fluviispira multicolorata]
MKKITVIKKSFKLLGKRGFKYILFAIFFATGIAIVELSMSFIIQLLLTSFGFVHVEYKIFDNEIPKFSIQIVSLSLVFISIVRFIVQLLTTQTAVFLREYIFLKLRQFSIYSILFENDEEDKNTSSMNFKISEIFNRSADFISYFTNALCMLVQSFFLFLLLFIIAWKEAIISSLGIAIIGCIILYINKLVSMNAKQVPVQQIKLNEGIEKIARNFLFIKLMKKRDDEYQEISEALKEYSSKATSAGFYSNLGTQTGPFLGILLLVCIILISNNIFATNGAILVSFIYLLARFIQSLSILSGYYGNATIYFPQFKLSLLTIESPNFSEISKDNFDKILLNGYRKKIDVKKNYDKISLSDSHKLSSPTIYFKDVTFSYPNSNPIFENLNLTFEKGSQTGLIGPSGVGKSTLLLLITGLLQPTSGQTYINEIPPWEYVSQKNMRIGYVGAEPFLIKGTIKDNICYGLTREVNEQDIYNILEKVSLKELIDEKGLSYIIAEDQSGLSAGQKQRLCLARALLNEPALLILDEATANLDDENELLIAQILADIKSICTTIIVSHRIGILKYADKVIDLKLLKSH